MTARSDLDLVLSEWMTATAHVVEPEGLHDEVVARVPAIRQRPGWLAGRAARGFGHGGGASARRMSLVAVVAAVTVAGIVWSVMPGAIVPDPSASPPAVVPPTASPSALEPTSSTLPPPRPGMEQTDGFILPFEFKIPEGSRLVRVDDGRPQVISWAFGPRHGITVAAGQTPWAHSATGRFTMRGMPAEVVERLQDQGGLDLEPVTPVELDGRPALASSLDDRDATDIHVGSESLPYRNYFQLNQPSQLIVSSVEGNVVFVTIWARTVEERDAFAATARVFVDSIHFIDPAAAPPASAIVGPTKAPNATLVDQFLVPFTFAVPHGSGLVRTKDDPHSQFASWVVGVESPAPSQLYAGQSVDSGVERGIVVVSEHRAMGARAGREVFPQE